MARKTTPELLTLKLSYDRLGILYPAEAHWLDKPPADLDRFHDALRSQPGLEEQITDERGNAQDPVKFLHRGASEDGSESAGLWVILPQGAGDAPILEALTLAADPAFESQAQRDALAGLRATRDELLAASDKHVLDLPDAPPGLKAKREAWEKYRQALRDYPAAVKDPLKPPPLPEPPS